MIGGSKGIGLAATTAALAAGHAVRVLARGADRMDLSHPKLEKFKGSALEPADVEAALAGVDAVIQALGVAAGPDMVLKPVRLFSEATKVLLPAMEKAGVRRLIAVTGFGAGDSRSALGVLPGLAFDAVLGRAYRDKDVQERLIKNCKLDWTIVRPVILTNGPGSGRYKVLLDPDSWRQGLIARVDVADFLIKALDDDRYLRQAPVLTY